MLVAFGLRLRVAELPVVALKAAAPPIGWEARRPATAPQPAAIARHRPRTPRTQEQVLMKIETNDPDVVVLWITETKGEN
jgi:hypothetical protein